MNRKNKGKLTSLGLIILVFSVVISGCAKGGAGSASGSGASGGGTAKDFVMRLEEPSYAGPGVNTKPTFDLKWSAYPGCDAYEIAIYAEGEDAYGRGPFAIRSTKNVYDDTGATLYFLQKVYTDTVRYRIKVRPDINLPGESDGGENWSNIWEIDFTDGEYKVQETTADFDEEIAAKEKQETPTPTPTPTPKIERKEPLPHNFPESLAEYYARERGEETPVSLDNIARLSVYVNNCEYGEPEQVFTDEKTLEQFKAAVSAITVTGKEDEIVSTNTTEGYYATDADGNTLISFSIQEGLLVASDARYAAEGLGALSGIEAVKSSDDWTAYWNEYTSKADEYERGLGDPVGLAISDTSYALHELAARGAESLSYASSYIDWNQDVGRFRSSDAAEMTAFWDAFSKRKVGEETDADGQDWKISFDYFDDEAGFIQSAYASFRGNCVEIGDDFYLVEGLEEFCNSLGGDYFTYLRDFATAPKVDPSY